MCSSPGNDIGGGMTDKRACQADKVACKPKCRAWTWHATQSKPEKAVWRGGKPFDQAENVTLRQLSVIAKQATEPVVRSAASSQAAGMQRLSGQATTVRRMVTLPALPTSTVSEPAFSQSSQSGPAPLLPPVSVNTPTLSLQQRRDAEASAKVQDRHSRVWALQERRHGGYFRSI
ncbi:hypothetical protein C8R44DRAFT_731494 [Mycena epipterygia]|nr:hypothetical protein C8R44DRAFT_731494 [Mycena epipterygia]